MRRSASEIINDLESRIARLEKSASITDLMDNFSFDESDSPREIATKLQNELGELFQNVSWNITEANADSDEVEFKGQISGIIPAEMIPTPFSAESILLKLQDVFGENTVDVIESFDSYAMILVDNEVAKFIFITLSFYAGKWTLSIEDEGDSGEIPDSFWDFAKSVGFEVKSTGSVSEDVDLLTRKLNKLLKEFKRFRG